MRVGYLGPPGTFTEQAVVSQADWAEADLVPLPSIPEVLAATQAGEVDLGVVPIENAIEGSVNVTLDSLAFLFADLWVQREVVVDVELCLLVVPGTSLADVREVVSFPVASAQCRAFLGRSLPSATVVAATSTAEAARLVGELRDPAKAAIGPALAGKLYGLDVAASGVEDVDGNQTRFVGVAPAQVPAATGHDKTTIVCFQDVDRPGSLLAILQEFAARSINLTRLESRPTRQRLGDYCFVIDLEGHVADAMVADCLRELRSKYEVRFLGSYPAASPHGDTRRRDAEAAWQAADAWLQELRARIS